MFINPKTAIAEGWITWNDNVTDIEKHLQPNAIDFDCATIFNLDSASPAFLSETSKKMRASNKLSPSWHDMYVQNVWTLENNKCYDFSSNFHVTLPQGVAAELIIRSTLNRNGVFLTSGIFDSGYSGQIAGMLRVHGGDFILAPNTRIGQIKFIRSEDSGIMYAGGYNHAADTHWSENKATPTPN
jgi:deoxycytidine triphosphate deaminase